MSFHRPIYQGRFHFVDLDDYGAKFKADESDNYLFSLAAMEAYLKTCPRIVDGLYEGTFVLRSDRQGVAPLTGNFKEDWYEFQNQQELKDYIEDMKNQDMLGYLPVRYR